VDSHAHNITSLIRFGFLSECSNRRKRHKPINEIPGSVPVDGVVGLPIELVGAPFTNDKAEWHGTTQNIQHSGDGLAKFITGQKYTGSIAASLLKVTIWDRKETLLYSWAGGIEVLMQREGQSLKIYA